MTFVIIAVIGVIAVAFAYRSYRLGRELEEKTKQLERQAEIADKTEKYLRRIANVFHNSGEGIIITDPKMVIIDVNEAYCAMTGYSTEELIGKKPVILYANRHDLSFYADMNHALERDGSWRGEVWDKKKTGEEYVKFLRIDAVRNSDGSVESFICIVSDVTENQKANEQLQLRANYDVLTGLPNRHLFIATAQKMLPLSKRRGSKTIIAFIDLDGFKQVNDQFGHTVGDRVLKKTTERIVQHLRQSDMLARIGGDEFLLMLGDINSMSEARPLLDRILAVACQPFSMDGQTVSASISIGVTLYPDDDSEIDTLIRHADEAMYRSKKTGKNRITYFQDE